MSDTIKQITAEDFERAFDDTLSSFLKNKIENMDLRYQELSKEENDKVLIEILKHIFQGIKKSGRHRIDEWNSGWGENRDELKADGQMYNIVPKYFGKYPYVRWFKNLIKPVSKTLEYNMASVLQYWLFEKYFKNVKSIYEFGCGTGHNLFRVEEINKTAKVYGLDWASSSQETIQLINNIYGKNFGSHRFDFFNVDNEYRLDKKSGVYTFAALEQIGKNYEDFVNYLIKQEPSVCLHVEPIAELLDADNILTDFLSVKYFEERNYLNSFYDFLKMKQDEGIIEILNSQRSNMGSLYVDGYSIVAWRVKGA